MLGFALTGCRDTEITTYDDITEQLDARIARLQDVEDQDLKDLLRQGAFQLSYSQEVALAVDVPVQYPRYIADPFAVVGDYVDLDDMASNYAQGLLPFTSETVFRGDVNVSHPFPYLFESSFEWADVELADGTTAAINNDVFNPGNDVMRVRGNRSLDMVVEGPDTVMPVRVTGEAVLWVPETVTRLTLRESDVDVAQSVGTLSVMLTRLSQNTASLEVRDTSGGDNSFMRNPVVVAARDPSGLFVDDTSWSRGQSAEFATALATVIDDGIDAALAGDIPPADIRAAVLLQAQGAVDASKSTYSIQIQFSGSIETLELLVGENAEPRTFPIDLRINKDVNSIDLAEQDDDFSLPEISTTAIAVDHEYAYLTAPDPVGDLTPDQLNTAITPFVEHNNGEDKVTFYYPPNLASSLFLSLPGRIDDASAFFWFNDGRGTPVSPQPEFDLNAAQLYVTVQDGETRPKTVGGTFEIDLVSDVKVETFSADNLPDEVSINGNRLSVGPIYYRVFAIDEQGHFLQQFHDINLRDGWDDLGTVRYYYGQPTGVVVVSRGDATPHTYRFEVDLAEPSNSDF